MNSLISAKSTNTRTMSLAEAATFLGISKSTLYKKTHNREISFNKPGGKLIQFLKEDLDSYLTRNRILSQEEVQINYLDSLKKNKQTNKDQLVRTGELTTISLQSKQNL